MVKAWLSSCLWLPLSRRACSFKVVQMVSRSMRDWQHAMAYGLTNCCNIHHFKQVPKPFDPERGWFKTIGNITVTSNDIASRWLAPGQLH